MWPAHLPSRRRSNYAESNAMSENHRANEEFHTSKTGEDKKLDRTAEQAAEKAGKTERRYDQDHDIFTK